VRLVGWGTLAFALAMTFACKDKAPPPPPPFSVADASAKLAALALDDAFFATLDAVKANAASDPKAMQAYLRFDVDAIGAALAANNTAAAKRLLGADASAPGAVGKALAALAGEAKKQPATQALSPVLAAVAGVHGGPLTGDVTKALDAAAGTADTAPGIRLLLASALAQAVTAAADAPEAERGFDVAKRLPGLTNPMTRDPSETVFPATLRTLAKLLAAGPGANAALAPAFRKVADAAEASIGKRLLPVTVGVAPGAGDRGAPVAVSAGFLPLAAVTVAADGLHAGSRPALAWNGGKPEDRTKALGWPGAVVAKPEDLEAAEPSKAAVEAVTKAVADASAVEAEAYKALAGKAVLNAERAGRPRALVVDVGEQATPALLKGGLAVAVAAGATDLRLLVPGGPGRTVPFIYRSVPKLPDVEAPKGPRVLAVIGPGVADLYLPPKAAAKLPMTGWPSGTKPVADNKKFFKLAVAQAHSAQAGFGGAVTAAVAALAKQSGASPFVDVVVLKPKEADMLAVRDLVQEIAAAEVPAFEGLATYFPGVECPEGRRCPSFVPVLFSDAAVPKPSKPDTTVTETRPAGFCEKGAVQRVVLGRSGAYRACYEVELQRHPELAGRVELRFTIEPDGSVSGIAVTSDELGSPSVTNCLVKQVSGLNFPKPDGGICVIRWPFKFQPGG
jgi:hypothetical protein